MTAKTKLSQKILSIFLCVTLLMTCLPLSAINVSAAALNDGITKKSDPSTLNGWTNYFYRDANDFDTENAGGIWTDKTVL